MPQQAITVASFKTYLSESYNELVNKVSWPTWKELQGSAIVVLVTGLFYFRSTERTFADLI